MIAADTSGAPAAAPAPTGLLRRALRLQRMRIGLVLTGTVVVIALFGPFVAPHDPSDIIGIPYAPPSSDALLGTDYLGQDVLSRVLWGGRSVLWMTLVATVLGVAAGATVGLVAAYSRSWLDDVLMRTMDVIFAFPAIVLVLLFVSMIGPSPLLIACLVALAWMPEVARVIAGTTREIVPREYVEAAEVVGTPRRHILRREILPNIATPLMVEFGLRLTWSIGIIAAISFLGQGLQPPAADWGLMINQNRQGLIIQPWGVVTPVICIGLFAFGTNLMTEAFSWTVAGIQPRRRRRP